jgi:hypothetical protein
MMASIKQYRVVGINYIGESYELVHDFNRTQGGNNASYVEGEGYPQSIAESLVVRWNATVDLYRRQDPQYRGPTYSLVIPEPEAGRPVSVADFNESEEAAYELVRYGQWSLTEFQSWMAKMIEQSYDDGRNNT